MEHKDIIKLPIYQKALEIGDLIRAFIETIPEDDLFLTATARLMSENAAILPAKIAGAEGGDYYDIRMQNAAIIRQAGLDLYVQVGALRFQEEYNQPEYIEMIRIEIETFREMFVQWVNSFDFTLFNWDDWGLFNPPHLKIKNPFDEIDWDKEDEESDRDWEELQNQFDEEEAEDDDEDDEDDEENDDLPDWMKEE